MSIKIYQVGGHVRDTLLGIKSKDIDYAVEADSWGEMRAWVHTNCKTVFLEKPEFLTIRALTHTGQAVDFVMCRKDGAYSDGRHPNQVTAGTIYDDLARRDFTVNAMAINEANDLIDPFNGLSDLRNQELKCVGLAEDRFNEDALRILRAMRFSITKHLNISSDIRHVFKNPGTWIPKLEAISSERKREELYKCLAFSTPETLGFLSNISPQWTRALFSDGLWLKPTMEQP